MKRGRDRNERRGGRGEKRVGVEGREKRARDS